MTLHNHKKKCDFEMQDKNENNLNMDDMGNQTLSNIHQWIQQQHQRKAKRCQTQPTYNTWLNEEVAESTFEERSRLCELLNIKSTRYSC